jgi:hypothetical protein
MQARLEYSSTCVPLALWLFCAADVVCSLIFFFFCVLPESRCFKFSPDYFTLDDSREMSSPSPGSATSEDATAASGEGMKGLVKLCRLFGRNNSRSRTILVSSRALMVAAAAMSLSQVLV